MDKFLERCKLSRLTQEEIDNPKSLVSVKYNDFVVKKFPIKKISGLDGVTNI